MTNFANDALWCSYSTGTTEPHSAGYEEQYNDFYSVSSIAECQSNVAEVYMCSGYRRL